MVQGNIDKDMYLIKLFMQLSEAPAKKQKHDFSW